MRRLKQSKQLFAPLAFMTVLVPMIALVIMLLGTQAPAATVLADGVSQQPACDLELNEDQGTDNLFTVTADSGEVVTAICIKSGPTHPGGLITEDATINNCYTVTGIGTNQVTVTRIGSGMSCQGISHVDYSSEVPLQEPLEVTKTAEGTFTRTFEWTIVKSVTPETWDLFNGDSGTSEYTVTLTKGQPIDSGFEVSGQISIFNDPLNLAATIQSVDDTINEVVASVDCGVTFPHDLEPGETLECTYSADEGDGLDGDEDLNIAAVTTSGVVPGGEGQAAVVYEATLVDDTVNVSDTFADDLGNFSDSGSETYERTFTCEEDHGTHGNTATIDETGQSDGASVTVNCYQLAVEKTAHATFTRTWDWTIEKSADETALVLSEGQLFEVNYEVTVDAASTDSAWAVAGSIMISNNHPTQDADLTEVADIVSPDIAPSVICLSLTVPADGTLECTYSTDLPDGSDRSNTATATQQNFAYDSDGVGTPSGTSDYSGSADVTFGDLITEIDECINVSDDNVGIGSLGTVCAGDAPETFKYNLVFGAHEDAGVVLECGENDHPNTASFVSNDSGATGEDEENVHAFVACGQGCTLTPGYWKTHSDKGPAPFDDTWDLLANGSGTQFFLSSQTYYEVLWTAPKGNAYYILARAYIAAELNQLNGASIPANVLNSFNTATGLFENNTPAQIAALKGNNPVRAQFIAMAGILDGYNNGITGPGHCSEDETSAQNG